MSQIKKRRITPYSYTCAARPVDVPLCHNAELLLPPLENSEKSFISWFHYIQTNLPSSTFDGMLHLSFINTKEDYCSLLRPYTEKCQSLPSLDRQLNTILCQSVSEDLRRTLSLSATLLSCCNFETIKWHFQARINVFHLMDLENQLFFNSKAPLQFLTDLTYLCTIYALVFGIDPPQDVKVNWILNALNRDPSNGLLLQKIQANWSVVAKDLCELRRIILTNKQTRRT